MMKFQKTTLLSLALSLLLACCIGAASASGPMENAVPNPGSAEAVFVQSIVSDLTEEEQKQLDPILDQITMQHISLIQDPSGHEALPAVQSTCPHIHTTPRGQTVSTVPLDGSTHTVTVDIWQYCNDCSTLYIASRTVTRELHSFGAGAYVGSNHTAADPSQHYLTFSRRCSCQCTTEYTAPAGCTKSGCVNPYSVTPQPASDQT